MTTSVLNQRRRRQARVWKRTESRRERHTQGDYRFSDRTRPNEQRDTWHQSKAKR